MTACGDFSGYSLGPAGVPLDRMEGIVEQSNRLNPELLGGIDLEKALSIHRVSDVPDVTNDDPLNAWAGLRPLTPDSLPIIGRVPKTKNLWMNTGHAGTGWMTCMSSADVLSSLFTNNESGTI